jgi:hypothetical protein
MLMQNQGGIALAPAIVLGYLMYKYEWNFDYALNYIQNKRYCVSPMSVSLIARLDTTYWKLRTLLALSFKYS